MLDPVRFTPRKELMYPRTGDWVGPRAGLEVCEEEKIASTRVQILDRPARTEPLHRLLYRGPEWKTIETKSGIQEQYYFPFEMIQFVHFLSHLVWKKNIT